MPRDFQNLNDAQVQRVWNKLYDRLGDGGWYGWDWPTLRAVNPGLYNSLVRVANEVSHRAQESLNA